MLSNADLVLRLALAAGLGAIIGFEREIRQKEAGLRTNTLIVLGATVMTIMSLEMVAGTNGDPSRIASQIVTGIGFLGAGVIVYTQGQVQGLTTAATIWVDAGIGMAVGAGRFELAGLATLTALVALTVLTPIDRFFANRHNRSS